MPSHRVFLGTVLVLLLIACIVGTGCTAAQETGEAKSYGTVIINMCAVDPDNADIWPSMDVNLWRKPGGLAEDGQRINAKIPSCQGIEVEIIDITDYEGLTYYKVRYGDKEGWITKRLATGEE